MNQLKDLKRQRFRESIAKYLKYYNNKEMNVITNEMLLKTGESLDIERSDLAMKICYHAILTFPRFAQGLYLQYSKIKKFLDNNI